ncbi:MAG: FKBP-type peptidyl-prolyl cis-trans isomerase [Myxococcota bacterium]|jgi:FKBP-type peptidyl-prolyl cis-trans isomerase
MERNQLVLVGVLSTLLFAAIAFGTVLRGTSEPQVPAPEPAPAAAPSNPKADAQATRPAKPPARPVPPRAHEVPGDDAYTTTESGLKFYDIVEGDGPAPSAGDDVVVEYSGFLADGTPFDSSYKRADPFRFTLARGRVIAGWDEGVLGMKIGGTRQLKIPAALGYGERGAPPTIPPGATLIFDVELKALHAPVLPPELPDDAFTTTATGLRMATLSEGDGATPTAGALVAVNYTGWLPDGTVFDASEKRGKPLEFPVGTGMVIPGWDEGVLTMRVGEVRLLRIPSALAYGEVGFPPVIPPNAELMFQVELASIVKAAPPTTPAPAAAAPTQ